MSLMLSISQRPASTGKYIAGALCILLSALLPPNVYADAGLFEVTRAEAREVDGAWLLDGRLELELSTEAIDALESGVMLSIQMQFEMTRNRTFWTDEQIITTSRDFEMKYMALNQRYIVTNITTGEQKNYATLFSALRSAGRIRDWSVAAADAVRDGEDYNCYLRVVLNQGRLPGPLQLLAFWRGNFILESEWYPWTLR